MYWLFYCCGLFKDTSVLKDVLKAVPKSVKGKYVYKAKLAKSFFCCNCYEEGSLILKHFEEMGFPYSDCNGYLLEGLALGEYYDECVRVFEKIHRLVENQSTQSVVKPVQIYDKCYYAAFISYCKLNREDDALHVKREAEGNGVMLSIRCFDAACEMVDRSKEWKRLSQLVFDVLQKKNITVSDVQ